MRNIVEQVIISVIDIEDIEMDINMSVHSKT